MYVYCLAFIELHTSMLLERYLTRSVWLRFDNVMWLEIFHYLFSVHKIENLSVFEKQFKLNLPKIYFNFKLNQQWKCNPLSIVNYLFVFAIINLYLS